MLILNCQSRENVFSSTEEMKTLCHSFDNLKIYEKDLDTAIKALDFFFDYNYQDLSILTEENAEEYVSNPINIFRMIERLSYGIEDLNPSLGKLRLHQNILSEEMNVSKKELETAGRSLLELQQTFQLDVKKLSQGIIQDIKSNSELSGEDLAALGDLAFTDKSFDTSFDFLKAATLSESLSENTKTYIEGEVIPKVIKTHDETLLKKGSRGADWRTFDQPLSKERPKLKGKVDKVKLFEPDLPYFESREISQKLCRGENLRSPQDDLGTKCTWLRNSPYLKLAPFKLEILNEIRFQISVIHDFLSEKQIKIFLDYSNQTHSLKESVIEVPQARENPSNIRTSKQTWLPENLLSHDSVLKNIELATKLRPYFDELKAEKFQVVNYGIGGVYKTHYDTLDVLDGPRKATFMIYLTDVVAGGSTVFPFLGLGVNPKKGKAVFWQNLDEQDQVEKLSFHGGCPVIKGSKWIANKWLHSQFTSHNKCNI